MKRTARHKVRVWCAWIGSQEWMAECPGCTWIFASRCVGEFGFRYAVLMANTHVHLCEYMTDRQRSGVRQAYSDWDMDKGDRLIGYYGLLAGFPVGTSP